MPRFTAILIPILIAILTPVKNTVNFCRAEGQLTVFQHCAPGTVWYAFVKPSQPAPPDYQILTSDLTTRYGSFPEGTSLKIGRVSHPGPITQFEFGWDQGEHKVWYDLSSLDGTPFANDGMEVYTDHGPSAAFPMCQTLTCPAGYPSCTDVFHDPSDHKSMSCNENTSMIMGLCIGAGFGDPHVPPSE